METIGVQSANTSNSRAAATEAGKKPQAGFEIAMPDQAARQFDSFEDLRDAILRGEVGRTSRIRKLGAKNTAKAASEAEWKTVEELAKSHTRLRQLYAPIWSMSLKGAMMGLLCVGVLKGLDTLLALWLINPGAAILWLLFGAFMFSPKFKAILFAVAVVLAINSGANVMYLWGAWIGVGLFAAAFGITAGMAVGTVIGLLRGRTFQRAPDAVGEGNKPLIWGLAVPVASFVIALSLYAWVVMPAALKALHA